MINNDWTATRLWIKNFFLCDFDDKIAEIFRNFFKNVNVRLSGLARFCRPGNFGRREILSPQ